MRILHTVEFYHPSIGGMQEAVRQLSERLVRLGHEVTVATTRLPERRGREFNGVRIAEFAVAGNLVRGITGEVEAYREFVLGGDFDIVTNFAAQQWATDALLSVLDSIRGRKVLVPTGFSGLHDERYREYYQAMPAWLQRYDTNVFLAASYRDFNFARAYGIPNTVVIPNGAAEDEFLTAAPIDIRAELGIPREHFLVLHVGTHSGLKGHAETIAIFGRSRLHHATLLLIGNDNGPGTGCIDDCLARSGRARFNPFWRVADKYLQLRTLDRTATVAAFQAADLLLFPSRIECSPLVLFEAMASRTPFLATDVGSAMEIVDRSQGGLLLPTRLDEDGFHRAEVGGSARLLESLWQDPQRRLRLAEAGFTAWRDGFTWEKIARRYEELYASLLRGSDMDEWSR